MTPLVKAVLALALVVPLVAYVAGSLASSGAETPDRQGTVYIDDVEPASDSATRRTSPTTRPTPSPVPRSPTRDNQPTPSPSPDDEEARVVAPTPVADDDERDDHEDDDRDDTDDGDDTDD